MALDQTSPSWFDLIFRTPGCKMRVTSVSLDSHRPPSMTNTDSTLLSHEHVASSTQKPKTFCGKTTRLSCLPSTMSRSCLVCYRSSAGCLCAECCFIWTSSLKSRYRIRNDLIYSRLCGSGRTAVPVHLSV